MPDASNGHNCERPKLLTKADLIVLSTKDIDLELYFLY